MAELHDVAPTIPTTSSSRRHRNYFRFLDRGSSLVRPTMIPAASQPIPRSAPNSATTWAGSWCLAGP